VKSLTASKTNLVVAVSGKGGVGKTSIIALMIKLLSEDSSTRSILAIDANPDSNLPNVLGISVNKTVGMVTDELKKSIEKAEIPLGMTKDVLESQVFEILKETPNFDLLVMGRGEGEGCYCPVNALLTRIIDTLSKNYDLTLMDMEAGLEHLSRRTDRDVDIMFIVTDPSSMGLQTAKRVKELAKEVHIQFKKIYLIANRFKPEMEAKIREDAFKIGVEFAGIVPYDDNVFRCNMEGRPLTNLSNESPAVDAVRKILLKTGLLN
jgi:CO dehydrogenase maturation factor